MGISRQDKRVSIKVRPDVYSKLLDLKSDILKRTNRNLSMNDIIDLLLTEYKRNVRLG